MKKAVFVMTILLFAAALAGCGKTDDELEQYKADMTAFTETINDLVASIDNIDLNSDTRTEELLGYLDEMDAAFAEMGALEVPKQFANIEELADDASANLSQSVALYHQAFDDEGNYDPQLIEAALEYYSRAFKRLDYIGTILQGELPEDETITIIHESGDEADPEETQGEEEQHDGSEEKSEDIGEEESESPDSDDAAG